MPSKKLPMLHKEPGLHGLEGCLLNLCNHLRSIKPDRNRADLDRIAQEARESQVRSWARKLLEAAGIGRTKNCSCCGAHFEL